MLSIVRLFLLGSMVLFAVPNAFAEDEGLGPNASAQNDGGEPTKSDLVGFVVMAADYSDRNISVMFTQDGEVDSITLETLEDSPLRTDRYLDMRDIRSISATYVLSDLPSGLRVKRLLAMPVGVNSTDKSMVIPHSAWEMEIPYGMQGSKYMRKEWLWPKEHRGIVILVEFDDQRWGFIEVLPPQKRLPTKYRVHEFLSPLPETAEALAAQIRRSHGWPEIKKLSSSPVTAEDLKREYFSLSDTHEYLQPWFLEGFFDSPKYRSEYHIFSDEKGSRKVEKAFGTLLKLAKDDEADAIKASVEGNEHAWMVSHWAVFHFLSISSKENLKILWTAYENEIINMMAREPSVFPPEFYAKLFKVLPKNPRKVILISEILMDSGVFEDEFYKDVYPDVEIWNREWLMSDPKALFDAVMADRPSASYLRMLKEALITVPHSKLDAHTLSWLTQVVLEDRGEKNPDVTSRRAYKALKSLKKQSPDLWRKLLSNGRPHLSGKCQALLIWVEAT